MQITGCVITFNEQARIAACLRSLAVCDELLVVDSRSTDRTRDIAAGAGARVIERDWPGYRSQKQFAIEAAAHDWVLVLDADETLSPALAGEIETLRRRGPGEFAGFSMPRRWIYFDVSCASATPGAIVTCGSSIAGAPVSAATRCTSVPWCAARSGACRNPSCTIPTAISRISAPSSRGMPGS